MIGELDAGAIGPLLGLARDEDVDPDLRAAALDAASRFPLSTAGWQAFADANRRMLHLPPGSPARCQALEIAARIPLLSVRRGLREMAADPDRPDAGVVRAALCRAGDPTGIATLLLDARNGREESYELLARMPLEEAELAPDNIPELPDAADPDARFWRALACARVGELGPLDDYLFGRQQQPPMFWGNPWTPYERIAAIRPVPAPMYLHLLAGLEAAREGVRIVEPIAWAVTGVADAFGTPIEDADEQSVPSGARRAPTPEEEARASETADRLIANLDRPDPAAGHVEADALVYLPEQRIRPLVLTLVKKANRRAHEFGTEMPAEIVLGNLLIAWILAMPPARDWPVRELAAEQLAQTDTAMDDGQLAWVLSRAEPGRVIRELSGPLLTRLGPERKLRLLVLLGSVADVYSGRAPSPGRGAGPGGGAEPTGRGPLIDDGFEAAAAESEPILGAPPPAAPSDAREPGESPAGPEERRIHAHFRQDGRRRRTLVAGAENVIRCWIGLPDRERTDAADGPIPDSDIPPEGLPLEVRLLWNDQQDHQLLVLPADRTASTRVCDLRLTVPEDEAYVVAELAFLYRGRVFEWVRVEGFVLPPGEPEQPHHEQRVRRQIERREVIELTDRTEYDSILIWGSQYDEPDPSEPNPESLLVFGREGQGRFDLSDGQTAVAWLNEELFATAKSVVRSQVAAGHPDGVLEVDNEEVVWFLRELARHGSALYNELESQSFPDPGDRIQILNRSKKEYVPIEFVYDRGYPRDDAKLCAGWIEVLESDASECPVCKPKRELTAVERTRMESICPLGFWSLQKIIERVDQARRDEAEEQSVPRNGRAALPPIEDVIFAASSRVPLADQNVTWQALQKEFAAPKRAEDWNEWMRALDPLPPLLVALPHHDVSEMRDYLEIGDENAPHEDRRLNRGQLTDVFVNPKRVEPGPIVVLLGCQTGARTASGYADLARRFQQLHTSIVVGTLAKILGQHAGPVARELIQQLVDVKDSTADFGTIMRRVRRRMLGKGYLMALCLVALGDADWRLTPRR